MTTRAPFAIDEWYHCYNRGVDKRKVFETKADYRRFLLLLYLCNATERLHVSDLRNRTLIDILSDTDLASKRGDALVEIGAYVLMPNHFHVALKEIAAGGTALFMQKVLTGYTMYFNKKRDRTGALFAGTFKAKHVSDDMYFKRLIAYIHMNPTDLIEPKWKDGIGNIGKIQKYIERYPYGSLSDFMSRLNLDSMERETIISPQIDSYFDSLPDTRTMLEEAREYYSEMEMYVKV